MKHFTPKNIKNFQLFPRGENGENVETGLLSNLRLGLVGKIKWTGVTLHRDPAEPNSIK